VFAVIGERVAVLMGSSDVDLQAMQIGVSEEFNTYWMS